MAGWAYRHGVRRAPHRCPAAHRAGADGGLAVLPRYYRHRVSTPMAPLVGLARVVDGDSIEIAGARVRLEGIDAPELNQSCTDSRGQPWSCGRTAAQELRSHIAGRELRCEPSGRDRYDRMLAICVLPDGSDVNAWLVRQGWALASGRATRLPIGAARGASRQARHLGRNLRAALGMAAAATRNDARRASDQRLSPAGRRESMMPACRSLSP